jgi:hypothetical protein
MTDGQATHQASSMRKKSYSRAFTAQRSLAELLRGFSCLSSGLAVITPLLMSAKTPSRSPA